MHTHLQLREFCLNSEGLVGGDRSVGIRCSCELVDARVVLQQRRPVAGMAVCMCVYVCMSRVHACVYFDATYCNVDAGRGVYVCLCVCFDAVAAAWGMHMPIHTQVCARVRVYFHAPRCPSNALDTHCDACMRVHIHNPHAPVETHTHTA